MNVERKAWWRRQSVRRLLAAAVVLVALAAMHRPLLRGVASFLIVDQPLAPADYLVLLPGTVETGVEVDEVARRYAAGECSRCSWLFEPPDVARGDRCGAWSDWATALRRDLEKRGIAPGAIVVLPDECRTSWDAAESLQPWLEKRPETRLIVLERLMRGRHDWRILNSVLGGRQVANLQFSAIRGGIDENNWWQSREGIQLVFQNYAALAFDWCNGQSEQCGKPWTLEEFEHSLPPPTVP